MWLPRSDNDIALPALARAQAELITGSNTVTSVASSHTIRGSSSRLLIDGQTRILSNITLEAATVVDESRPIQLMPEPSVSSARLHKTQYSPPSRTPKLSPPPPDNAPLRPPTTYPSHEHKPTATHDDYLRKVEKLRLQSAVKKPAIRRLPSPPRRASEQQLANELHCAAEQLNAAEVQLRGSTSQMIAARRRWGAKWRRPERLKSLRGVMKSIHPAIGQSLSATECSWLLRMLQQSWLDTVRTQAAKHKDQSVVAAHNARQPSAEQIGDGTSCWKCGTEFKLGPRQRFCTNCGEERREPVYVRAELVPDEPLPARCHPRGGTRPRKASPPKRPAPTADLQAPLAILPQCRVLGGVLPLPAASRPTPVYQEAAQREASRALLARQRAAKAQQAAEEAAKARTSRRQGAEKAKNKAESMEVEEKHTQSRMEALKAVLYRARRAAVMRNNQTRSELGDAAKGCRELHQQLERDGDGVSAPQVGAVLGLLDPLVQRQVRYAELTEVAMIANTVAMRMKVERKVANANAMKEVVAKIKKAERHNLKTLVAQSKAAHKEAEVKELEACIETAVVAEEAAAALSGVAVQAVQALATVASKPHSSYEEIEGATAGVEVLEAELVCGNKLKEAKQLRTAAVKAKRAVSMKVKAEEAGLIGAAELELDVAADACHELQAKLEESGDLQTAAQVGELSTQIEHLIGHQVIVDYVRGATGLDELGLMMDEAEKASTLLHADDKEDEAVAIERVHNMIKRAKRIQLKAKAAHNKAARKQAVLHSCEAKMQVALEAEEASVALMAAGRSLQLHEMVALAELISKHDAGCDQIERSRATLCELEAKVVQEGQMDLARKLRKLQVQTRVAVSRRVKAEEAEQIEAADAELIEIADTCHELQAKLQQNADWQIAAARVGALASLLEGEALTLFDELELVCIEAEALATDLHEAEKSDEARLLDELATKVKRAKKIKLKARATHCKAAHKEAEAEADKALQETAVVAEEAAAALSGVAVQAVQALATVASKPHSSYEEIEGATAGVEVLEAELVEQGKLKELKKLRRVLAKARIAVIKQQQAEGAALASEASLDVAADACYDLQAKLEESGDLQTAAKLGALASNLQTEALSFELLSSVVAEAVAVTDALNDAGNSDYAAVMEEIVTKVTSAKRMELSSRQLYNKAALTEAQVQAHEANREVSNGAERATQEMDDLADIQPVQNLAIVINKADASSELIRSAIKNVEELEAKLVREGQLQDAKKMLNLIVAAKRAVSKKAKKEEVALIEQVEAHLARAMNACYDLQGQLTAADDLETAEGLGALAAYICENMPSDESNQAAIEANTLAAKLIKTDNAGSMEQVVATLKEAKRIGARANAVHKKVAQLEAEVECCEAKLDAANDAEAAAVVVGATGVDVQPLRAAASQVADVKTHVWELENAAAAVEQLASQLTSEGKLQRAKRMRKVAAKVRTAVSKKVKAEEAGLLGEIGGELISVVDACHELHAKMDASGDQQNAAQIRALAVHLEPLVGGSPTDPLWDTELRAVESEARAVIEQLHDSGNCIQGIGLEEATAKLRRCKKVNAQVKAIQGKVTLVEAQVKSCEAAAQATDEADEASVALLQNGINVQLVQVLATAVGDLSSSNLEDVEAAVTAVEALEPELVSANKLQDARTLCKVAAKAKVALGQKAKVEEATLLEEARTAIQDAKDACHYLQAKLELAEDPDAAVQVGNLEFALGNDQLTPAEMDRVVTEMKAIGSRVQARGKESLACSVQGAEAKIKKAQKAKAKACRAQNKCAQKDAEAELCEANMEASKAAAAATVLLKASGEDVQPSQDLGQMVQNCSCAGCEEVEAAIAAVEALELQLGGGGKQEVAEKLHEISTKLKTALSKKVKAEEAAAQTSLDVAAHTCLALQAKLEENDELQTAAQVGELSSTLDKIAEGAISNDDLDGAIIEAQQLEQILLEKGKAEEAKAIDELATKVKRAKKIKLKARATHCKAAHKEAEAEADKALQETAVVAEEAAAALSGVAVQAVQALATVASKPHSSYEEIEGATAGVEVLEAELVEQGKLKELKKLRRVLAKARIAVIKQQAVAHAGKDSDKASLEEAMDFSKAAEDALEAAKKAGDAEAIKEAEKVVKKNKGVAANARHTHAAHAGEGRNEPSLEEAGGAGGGLQKRNAKADEAARNRRDTLHVPPVEPWFKHLTVSESQEKAAAEESTRPLIDMVDELPAVDMVDELPAVDMVDELPAVDMVDELPAVGPGNNELLGGFTFEITAGLYAGQHGVVTGLIQHDDQIEAGNDDVEMVLVDAEGCPLADDDTTVGCQRVYLRVVEGVDAVELEYEDQDTQDNTSTSTQEEQSVAEAAAEEAARAEAETISRKKKKVKPKAQATQGS